MKKIFILSLVMVSALCSSFTTLNEGTPQNTSSNTETSPPSVNTNQVILENYLDQVKQEPEEVNWLTWKEAMALQQIQPRKIFVDLYTEWCVWCERMDKATFKHPAIARYINENFYPVKFDAETKEIIHFRGSAFGFQNQVERGYNLFSLYLTRGQLSYPSVVFLDEKLNNPQPVKGFQNPVIMDKLLHFFGENHYLKYDWGMFNQYYISPLQKEWIDRKGKKRLKEKKY